MPNYQEMYITLFRRVTAAINELQEAQRQTEEMYLSSEPPDIRILNAAHDGEDLPETEECGRYK